MMRSVVLAPLLAIFGCASDKSEDECARVRVDCPNEPSLVEECRVVAPVCPATARALFLCIAAHQVCDGRGRLDRTASAALCKEQRAENERCLDPDGAADSASDSTLEDAEDTRVDDTSDVAPEISSDTKSDGKPG